MRMFIRLLLALLLLAVLVIGGAAVFLATFDPNAHKDALAARVKAATGRDLVLGGPIDLALWPKVRLHVRGLALADAPGFGTDPMVALDELEVAIATLPLLRGRIEMETVRATGLAVRLARHADGVTNWDDLARQEPRDRAKDGGGNPLGALLLGGVDIRGASLHWQDALTERDVRISELTATSGALAFDTPIALAVEAKVESARPALAGAVSLTSTTRYDDAAQRVIVDPLRLVTTLKGKTLPRGSAEIVSEGAVTADRAAGTVEIRNLSVTGLDHRVQGELLLDHVDTARPGARGQLALAGKDLATLFRAFDLPAVAQVTRLAERGVDFRTEFTLDADTGRLAVPVFTAKVLGATLDLQVDGERMNSDAPALAGRITAKGPDFPALLVVGTALTNPHNDGATSLAKALAPVKARAFSLDAELTADLGAGQFALPRLDASLLGNTLTGRLQSAGGDSGKPAVTGEVVASGPDLTTLALAVGALQGLDGDALAAINTVIGKRADRSFTFRTTVEADFEADRFALPAVTAALFGNELTGSFRALSATSKQPSLAGEIAAQGRDLPALLALIGGVQGADSALPELAHALANATDKSFTLGGKFELDARDGRLELPALGASAMGLTLDGTLIATAFNHPSGGRIDGRLALQGPDLAPLLTALGHAELARSLRSLKFEAGVKGNPETLTLSPFEATLAVAGPGGAAPVDVTLTVGRAEASLPKETLAVRELALKGLGLDARGEFDATQLKSNPTTSGRIRVPAFNLRAALAALNMPVEMADAAALTRVGLEARVLGSSAGYALQDLVLALDDSTWKGQVSAQGDPSVITVALDVDRLNADRYFAPAGETKARPVTPEAAAAGAAGLPMDTLRDLRVDGRLGIGKLQLSGMQIANVQLALKARGGLLALDPVTADLYGGRYTGVMTLDATGAVPRLGLNTTLAKVALEPLLADATGKRDLAGTLNFEAKLTAAGHAGTQFTRTLNGPASFSITAGEVRGFDVPAILRAAELILESKTLQPVPTGGVTQFQSLTGSLEITNGAIFNRDLLLDGLGFKVAGEGMLANLADHTIKYDARVIVDETSAEQGASQYNLGGYAIPIRCRGEIGGSSCLPDFGELAKNAAAKAVKDKLKEKLEDSGAGKALKKLLNF